MVLPYEYSEIVVENNDLNNISYIILLRFPNKFDVINALSGKNHLM
jgi:hypothetical protein